MNYLLDTHTFIWLDNDPDKLSSRATNICQNTANTLYLSIVSIWEIQIKLTLGKLTLPLTLEEMVNSQLDSNIIQLLEINRSHIYRTDKLEFHHRDPFDRLLIAQALEESLIILSKDANMPQYPATVVWT